MCGIAGIATSQGLRDGDARLVGEMLGLLAHRGPDEQRSHADERVVIGARRLRIIDLETGSQPLSNEDGTVQVTQNGEIYNYVELRTDLEARGHTFRSRGDTETIAHLYEEYGDDFVSHLRGMFAIALWDARRHRLVLARDRLGKKPLYWRGASGRLTYGSELKAVLHGIGAAPDVDRRALALYLQYQYIPAPDTIFIGIHKLPAGTLLSWDGETVREWRYWMPSYEPKHEVSAVERRDECLALLRESVRLRLRSDVPVGLFLSGGLDSTTVLALMAELSEKPVPTFTIGFEDLDYDERHYARRVATHFGSDHTEELLRLDATALLPTLANYFDEPFGDSSALATFRIAQVAGARMRVVLTGDGGDEAFAGYPRYRSLLALDRFSRVPKPIRDGLLNLRDGQRRHVTRRGAGEQRSDGLREVLSRSVDDKYVWLVSMSEPAVRRRLMGGDPLADQDDFLLRVLRSGPSDPLERVSRADLLTYLPDDLMVKMDRATMASSLEARAPLLDHQLIEYLARMPAREKRSGRRTKPLLREIAETLLPRELLERPKFGFAVPLERWFRSDLADLYRATVLASDARIRDHLDQRVAAELLEDHISRGIDRARQMWLLLIFELWARRWLAPMSVGGG